MISPQISWSLIFQVVSFQDPKQNQPPYPRLPGWLSGKESACNAGDTGLILGLGRSLEKGMATHSSIPA